MPGATNTDYLKLKIAMRYYLLGLGFHQAVKAMEIANELHCGTRADKITPEFQHQIEMAHYLRMQDRGSLLFPEESYCVLFLHDCVEDYPEQLSTDDIGRLFGSRVADSNQLMTKPADFNKADQSGYFGPIATDPIASLGKGIDRVNNLATMVGVFSPKKQLAYATEVEAYFLPMLKTARRKFPEQELVYESIKFSLTLQLRLLRELRKHD